jgi:Ca2+-binding RTX toxin-like protein
VVDVQLGRKFLLALAALVAALAIFGSEPPVSGAAPSCADGPETVGSTIIGTPCDDTIRAPRGISTVRGEAGNDTLYGQRGNDFLYGDDGNDRLYGGIGDDQLRGGSGNDRLSGGFGADSLLDGEVGDDFVRGDATIDDIRNTGGGIDTLSYATAVTPGFFNRAGFPNFSAYANFPQTVDGRGAYIDLQTGMADNGRAPHGGGFDEEISGAEFEIVIGSAFPDYIVGTSAAQTIYGGGGAAVILGAGGNDQVFGGAEGDYCATAPGTVLSECEFSGANQEVEPRNPATVSAGLMALQEVAAPALYLTGSDASDIVVATYSSPTDLVSFTRNGSPAGSFDLGEAPDSVLLAGLGGNDTLTAANFPSSTSVIMLGGAGADSLTGGDTEDAVVDGDGDDTVNAGNGDDAVPNNEGDDTLHAGGGEDLFVSDSVCEGELLDGGPDRDNANWANFDFAVTIDMGAAIVGKVGTGGQLSCAGEGPPASLEAIEDTEGTRLGDVMIGDAGPNQLLGRPGPDSYFAAAGDDTILANSGFPVDDPDPVIDCGEGFDIAQIDFPENGPDAAPIACEDVEERAPNSFRPPETPLGPTPASASQAIAPAPLVNPPRTPKDRQPPQTRILRRPARVLFAAGRRRAVAFAFRANEAGSTFRCKIDRKPLRPCRSPRLYRLAAGPHIFRVLAIDRAGNRDRTPALFRFRIRRR